MNCPKFFLRILVVLLIFSGSTYADPLCHVLPSSYPATRSGSCLKKGLRALNNDDPYAARNLIEQSFKLDKNLWEAYSLLKLIGPDTSATTAGCNFRFAKKLKIQPLKSVFPFVSERNDKKTLYLKLIKKSAEYPLSGLHDSLGAWAVSLGGAVGCYYTKTNNSHLPGLLHITSLNEKKIRQIRLDGAVKSIVLSPDGSHLFFSKRSVHDSTTDLFRTPTWGEKIDTVVEWQGSNEMILDISFDNSMILFSSDRDEKSQIYQSSICGDSPLRLGSDNYVYTNAKFSPDGKKIAFLSDRNNAGGRFDLLVYTRGSSDFRAVTRNSNVSGFCWRSNSLAIVYSSGVSIHDLNMVELSSFKKSKLILKQKKDYAELEPLCINHKNSEKIIFVKEYFDGLREIFWVNSDGSKEQKIVGGRGVFEMKNEE